MSETQSLNTRAILLLTAPLIVGRGQRSRDLLAPAEYRKLVRHLRELGHQPADLLTPAAERLLRDSERVIERARLERLLARGFQLSQAVERWQARSIWVASRADEAYPRRLKARLKDDSPALIYGCGSAALLGGGGLAVVGSRNVSSGLIDYTHGIGQLAALAHRTLVSGGARGVDQAAMHGALEAGGKVVGILADGLEKAALTREYRDALMDGRLLLICPYDPATPFQVGNAMQRNKLIYAFADAALIVNAQSGRGGTWAGAIEQLDKLKLVPVYVRSSGEIGEGLEALRRRGAERWPNPQGPAHLAAMLDASATQATRRPEQTSLFSRVAEPPAPYAAGAVERDAFAHERDSVSAPAPADALFDTVRCLLHGLETPKTDAEIAEELAVSKTQVRAWLRRLVQEGTLEKLVRPVRYRSAKRSGPRESAR